ncbi:amine oxidase [Aspergillus pseudoustus]|uniref:Amine oxidase n=1 Tax=Aspergillus pseudoustus TaxID=1810923 RepID=A0ABR4IEN5_9EURO
MAKAFGSQNTYDVVVVGAGLSGLQAAHSVHAAGFQVCLLEAIDRVGGKTLTSKSSERGFNDLGASWINDTNQSEMFKLYQRYGLETETQRDCGDTLIQSADGNVLKVPYGQLPGNPDVILRLLQVFRDECSLINLDNPTESHRAREIDQLTFREFSIQSVKSDEAASIADVLSASLLGVESDEVSALYMLLYFKSGAGIDNIISDEKNGGQYLRCRQGNQNIAQKMADELGPGVVFLHTPVTAIDHSRCGHCVVHTQSGRTFQCRKVIVSIPTSLYHRIAFSPRLPEKKVILSDNTATGCYTKLVYVFNEPWWHKANLSGVLDSEKGPIVFSRDTSIAQDHQWSITCFLTGDKGRNWSKLPRASRHRQAWKQFSQSFGKFTEVPRPANTLEMEWTKEAFFLGAPCPITTPGVLSAVGGEIATPVGNVHFVGTETSREWRGYMEGAIRSGLRGGAEVVRKLEDTTGRL